MLLSKPIKGRRNSGPHERYMNAQEQSSELGVGTGFLAASGK